MRIAIVGMGVAGSYLASRLSSKNHEVVAYERFTEEKFDCVCAWGTSEHAIRPYVAKCGLDFDDYILHRGRTMYVKFGKLRTEAPLVGLVTFDKHSIVKDMQHGLEINFGRMVRSKEELGDFDVIVDATAYRILLPKVRDELRIPSVQYSVEYGPGEAPFDDFYVEIVEGMGGYLWYFPLSENLAHVGAGDINHGHLTALKRFLAKYPGKTKKIVGRPIRLCPPSLSEPMSDGNVIGVGESIGSVFPLIGEGIIPTLQCAELLARNVGDFEAYRREVLRAYQIYDAAYGYVKSNVRGRFFLPTYLSQMNEIAQHVLKNEVRYGYRVSALESLLKARVGP